MYVTVACMPEAVVWDFIRVRKLSAGRLYACPGGRGKTLLSHSKYF